VRLSRAHIWVAVSALQRYFSIFKSIFSQKFFIWTNRQKFACPYSQIRQ
jgi:hypothetical protein